MKFRNNNNIYQYIKSRVEVDFRKWILIQNKNIANYLWWYQKNG